MALSKSKRRPGVEARPDSVASGACLARRLFLQGFPPSKNQIHRKPVKPSPEGRLPAKGRELLPGPDKNLLCQIFRRLLPRHSACESVDPRHMRPIQPLESDRIAFLGEGDIVAFGLYRDSGGQVGQRSLPVRDSRFYYFDRRSASKVGTHGALRVRAQPHPFRTLPPEAPEGCWRNTAGRAHGACARSDKERRRVVAELRRGGETQDQPHNRHVPTTMWGMTLHVEGLRWHDPDHAPRGAPVVGAPNRSECYGVVAPPRIWGRGTRNAAHCISSTAF